LIRAFGVATILFANSAVHACRNSNLAESAEIECGSPLLAGRLVQTGKSAPLARGLGEPPAQAGCAKDL
jgi:hypothetical protein